MEQGKGGRRSQGPWGPASDIHATGLSPRATAPQAGVWFRRHSFINQHGGSILCADPSGKLGDFAGWDALWSCPPEQARLIYSHVGFLVHPRAVGRHVGSQGGPVSCNTTPTSKCGSAEEPVMQCASFRRRRPTMVALATWAGMSSHREAACSRCKRQQTTPVRETVLPRFPRRVGRSPYAH